MPIFNQNRINQGQKQDFSEEFNNAMDDIKHERRLAENEINNKQKSEELEKMINGATQLQHEDARRAGDEPDPKAPRLPY